MVDLRMRILVMVNLRSTVLVKVDFISTDIGLGRLWIGSRCHRHSKKNYVRWAANAVKLHKSGGESGGKNFHRLVAGNYIISPLILALKLHKLTA